MRTWEYKEIVQTVIIKKGLLEPSYGGIEPDIDYDQLGNKGWELVSVTPILFQGRTVAVHTLFKRPTN